MIYPITKNGFLTHTFSECVENHAGMQMLGEKRAAGFAVATLRAVAARVEGASVVELGGQGGDEACVLVLKGGVNMLLKDPEGADNLLAESVSKPFDSTFLNVKRKVVQTKHGRYNNCYADAPQNPDIPNGKGTVVAFGDAPVMAKLRAALPEMLGEEAEGLFAETNYYKDVTDKKVGIGWHGDGERRVVIGMRVGPAGLPLRFRWYHRFAPVGQEIVIGLNHGDLYVMSDKATGHDWKSPSKMTLRHGVGLKAPVLEEGERKGAKRKRV